jgi:hypothetical protein
MLGGAPMKKLFALITFLPIVTFADSPPSTVVKSKTYTGDGVTPITATSGSLNVNITNPGGGTTTVNQGTAGASKWLVDGSGVTQPVSGTFWQTTQPVSGTLTCNAGTGVSTSALQTSGNILLGTIITDLTSGSQLTQLTGAVPAGTNTIGAVNINGTVPVSGTITATNSANGNPGSALPSQATLIGGSDGTDLRALQVSSAGVLAVSASSLPLPSGASTSALQTTGNTSLSSIASSVLNIPAQGQAIAADSLPVVLPAAQITALTPPTSISVSNFPATQPVSGTVAVSNFPSSQAVTGTFWQTTQPVSVSSLPLPTGAATSALQTTGNTSLATIATNIPAQGQALAADSMPVVLTAAQISTLTPPTSLTVTQSTGSNLHVDVDSAPTTAVTGTFWQTTQPVSGTFWQATQPVSATSLPLPTGAATSALQTTGNTSLSSIATNTANIPALGQALAANSVPVVLTTAQLSALMPLTTVAVTGTFWQTTQPVSIASLPALAAGSNTIGTVLNAPIGGATDSQTTGTVSTVITLTAPSNAQGFILQNLGTSTANLRFAMGATATTTLGMQLAPGQDSNFVPTSANVSLCAESGTQNYNIQWVAK